MDAGHDGLRFWSDCRIRPILHWEAYMKILGFNGAAAKTGAVAALLLTAHGMMLTWFVAPPLLESAAWLPGPAT